jgi:hypothetical protein
MILNDSGDFRVLRMMGQYCLARELGEDVADARCGSGAYHVRMPTKMVVYKFVAMDMT